MKREVIKTTVKALPLTSEEAKAVLTCISLEYIEPEKSLDRIKRLATTEGENDELTPLNRLDLIREHLDRSSVLTDMDGFVKDQDKKSDGPF